MSTATRSSIEVAIRVRPMRPEIHETKAAWELTRTTAREIANADTFFTFDHIYNIDATVQQLYDRSVQASIVGRVAQGYNGTVFAYGQTGSGKTFTMFGDGGGRSGRRSAGLIELCVQDLFAALDGELQRRAGSPLSSSPSPLPAAATAAGVFPARATGGWVERYEVYVSELEIYNEQLRDLLLPPGQPAKPLSIRENEYGVYVHNAIRVKVSSASECLRTIYRHAEARVSASTAMNDYSSRSHCIIQVHVEKIVYLDDDSDETDDDDDENDGNATATDDENDTASLTSSTAATASSGLGGGAARRQGKRRTKPADARKKKLVSLLNLVDLAGSERVAKTGAVGMRMVEGGHINKSLTALTTVINRLAEVSNAGAGAGTTANPFVPYRDSRLTHLLKTSIGGNSFTCIFCCVTPAIENVDESRSTFQFASRAKSIKNRVSVNEVMNPKTRVRELEIELRRVKRQLVAQTIYLWSKQVTIQHLQDRLNSLVGAGGGGGGADFLEDQGAVKPHTHSAASFASSQTRRREGPEAQREMIMAQLEARNAALEEELDTLKADLRAGGTPHSDKGTKKDGAGVAQLHADIADLESMLADMEGEKKAAELHAEELNDLCRQLEKDNAQQALRLKGVEEKHKEAEGLLDDLDDEREAAVAEAELLRSQLQKTQAKLLEKSRGDAYLEELTKLHIEHQELQFRHNQMKEASQKQVKELQAEVTASQQAQEDLEDEKEEVQDKCKQLNAYLWRFLALASLASKGRVDAEMGASAVSHAERPVLEKQIGAALESLTKAVSASRAGDSGAACVSKKEAAGLAAKVRALEKQLVYKDSQRDVLVDTKLKRMQDLVLRLHAINRALTMEMRQCYTDNDELFRMAQKHPKLAGKLSKEGLFPRSLQSALERARFAEPAEKPYGHN